MPTPAWALTKSADEAGARFFFRHRPTIQVPEKGSSPNVWSTTDGFHFAKSARRFLEAGQGAKIGAYLRICDSAAGKCATSAGRRAGEEAPHPVSWTQTCALRPCRKVVKVVPVRMHRAVSGARLGMFRLTRTFFYRKVDAQKLEQTVGEKWFPRESLENCVRSDNDAWAVL